MTGLSRVFFAAAGFGMVLLAGCSQNPSNNANRNTPQQVVVEGDVRNAPLASDQANNQRRAELRLQLAIGYYGRRQFDVALDEIGKALASEPNLADAYSVRALIYMEKGEDGLADSSFKTAMSKAPDNADYMNNYGWFLCQHGRAPESIGYFEKALGVRTNQAPSRALANAGVCSLRLNKNDDAMRYFKQALQFEPYNPLANAFMGLLLARNNERDRAMFYLGQLPKNQQMSALVLWTAIKAERVLGNSSDEEDYASRLANQYPGSPELIAYRRGQFDD